MNNIIIHSTEYKVADVKPIEKSFTFCLVFNSSESRALVYEKLFRDKSVGTAFLVNFNGEGSPEKAKNYRLNKEFLGRIAQKIVEIPLENISDCTNNLNRIAEHILIEKSAIELQSIFIDITGAPLVYSTALSKFLLRMFPSPEVLLLNVSGKYTDTKEKRYSEGKHRYDIYVPGFYGDPDYSKPYHYIFLLGYDGERSFGIYREHFPQKVSIIIPSPGYEEGNDKNTIHENRDFLMDSGYRPFVLDSENDGQIKAYDGLYLIDINDIQTIKKTIEDIYEEDSDEFNIRLVPLGPKPHALGAALSAVFNNDISMMYRVPQKYYMREIPPAETMWLYDVSVE